MCTVNYPGLEHARLSCASCCMSVLGAVDGRQLPRSIPSTIVHCGKDLFVRLLLPLPHHQPYVRSVRPEPQRSEGHWQLGSHLGSGQATPGWREMGFSASEDLILCQEAGRKPREELHPKEGLGLTALTRAVNDIQ